MAASIAPTECNSVPANYRKGARHTWHQRRRHKAVLRLLRRTRGKLLDYGCGYGDIAHAMSRTHDVHAVDVDAGRIAFAQREYAPLPFSVCDGGGVAYADAAFDVVASVVVIHFVPDARAYLQEVRRVLRPDGRLLIACHNAPVVRNRLRRSLGREKAPSLLWVPERPEFKRWLETQGFAIEAETHFYDPPFHWKGPADAAVGLIEQVLSLCCVRAACNYYVLLARKSDSG